MTVADGGGMRVKDKQGPHPTLFRREGGFYPSAICPKMPMTSLSH